MVEELLRYAARAHLLIPQSLEQGVGTGFGRSRVLCGDQVPVDDHVGYPGRVTVVKDRAAVLQRVLQVPRHAGAAGLGLVLFLVGEGRHLVAIEQPHPSLSGADSRAAGPWHNAAMVLSASCCNSSTRPMLGLSARSTIGACPPGMNTPSQDRISSSVSSSRRLGCCSPGMPARSWRPAPRWRNSLPTPRL